MSYANPYEIINKSRSKWMAVEVQTGFRLCLESNALQAPPARKRGRASYALHSRQSLERERKHYPPKLGGSKARNESSGRDHITTLIPPSRSSANLYFVRQTGSK